MQLLGTGTTTTTTALLACIVCMVLGGLIVAFDYPQIRYIEEMDGHVVSSATMQVYERLVVEFYIGTAMLTGGALVGAWGVVSGMLKKRTVQ